MNLKREKAIAIVVLVAALMLAVLSQTFVVTAQTDAAIVIIQPSVGGTTDPVPGTYTYENGTVINMVATPDAGYAFHYWVISGNVTPGHGQGQNTVIVDPDTGDVIGTIPRPSIPTGLDSLVIDTATLNVTCGYGYTFQYQAVFTPIGAQVSDVATVVILPSSFGTTNPPAGTYTYTNDTYISFVATPNAGYAFHYWVISGNVTPGHTAPTTTYILDPETGDVLGTIPRPAVPTGIDSLIVDVPQLDITCGLGYTFQYQAIFTPTEQPTPTATPTVAPTVAPTATPTVAPTASPSPTPEAADNTMWIILAAVVVVIIVAIVAFMMLRKKK